MEEPGLFGDFFSPIEHVMSGVLTALYSLTELFGVPSYGLAIILLTILIKILVYPLTKKQLRSMKAMQRIQPQLQKLQAKYKNNPQVMQEKMMELYQKEGANPMSGCLPMLIQMPVLMGMYYTLYSFNYGGAEPSFMWLPSLSETDPLYVLPLLSALTTYLTSLTMQSANNANQQNPQMKILTYIMPVFIGWISLSFPSGLVLYWVTMNVVQIVQQLWINKFDESTDKEAA